MIRPGRLTLSPRLAVLGTLLIHCSWAAVLPLLLIGPPSAAAATVYVVGVIAFCAALVLVLIAAVSPGTAPRMRTRSIGLLVVVTLAMWPISYAWAEPGAQPWAWLAGFAIGATVLAAPLPGVSAAVGLTAAAAVGAVAYDGSVVANVTIALGCAAVVWGLGQVLVWLLRLLWQAEAGRDAQAALAITQERLRVSRELHDALGHRLGVIALKAELAAEHAATDPARSAAESDEIRAIASGTLAEARRAVHGDTVADLASQLASAELVLTSAGIETHIDVDAGQVPDAQSRLLSAVVREAVTNLLRHSNPTVVSITYHPAASCPILMIVNDGVPPSAATDGGGSGTGLAALAARCAAAGARLRAHRIDEDTFEVRVELTPRGGAEPR